MRVATDVGGTFTDLVAIGPDGIITAKADTTPPDFDQGVINAIEKAAISPKDFAFFAHGTTVVINALLSRTGNKTALITTEGFRDVLEIARGNRPDLFNFAFKKPSPFVPRHLRFEMKERIGPDGAVREPLDVSSLEALGQTLAENKVDAVAVCFLHAYANPSHEAAVCALLRERWPDLSVVGSHEVCREWREYERTSTTVLSAYVHPIAKRYLGQLEAGLKARGLRSAPYIMQSNGGVTTVHGARNNPIALVESGPASGVLGAAALGRKIGEPNLIALDIGGTTAKTALIRDGQRTLRSVADQLSILLRRSRLDLRSRGLATCGSDAMAAQLRSESGAAEKPFYSRGSSALPHGVAAFRAALRSSGRHLPGDTPEPDPLLPQRAGISFFSVVYITIPFRRVEREEINARIRTGYARHHPFATKYSDRRKLPFYGKLKSNPFRRRTRPPRNGRGSLKIMNGASPLRLWITHDAVCRARS